MSSLPHNFTEELWFYNRFDIELFLKRKCLLEKDKIYYVNFFNTRLRSMFGIEKEYTYQELKTAMLPFYRKSVINKLEL